MKRSLALTLAAAIGLPAILAVGWSAAWMQGEAEAERQVRAALASLDQAGASSSYDAIEISGYPFSYRATVRRLALEGPAGAVTLPEVSAEISIDAADAVTFRLPETFKLLDKTSGDLFEASSRGLTATVSEAGANAYDLALTAESLRIAAAKPGGPGPLSLQGFAASGQFRAEPAQDQLRLVLAASAEQAVQDFSYLDDGGAAVSGVATLQRPEFDIEGSLLKLRTRAGAEKLLIDYPAGGVLELLAPAYEATVTPKDRFDPRPILAAGDLRSALRAFAEIAAASVADGGDFEGRFGLEALKGSGEIEGGRNAADIGAMSLKVDFGADRVGLEFLGEKISVDLDAPGAGAVFYEAEDLKTSLSALPAEAFDFSALPEAGDRTPDLLLQTIWSQIQRGGALTLTSSSGPSATRSLDPAAEAPFRRLESTAGPSEIRMSLTPESARLAVEQSGARYKLADLAEGEMALSSLSLGFDAPLKAAPGMQVATLRFALGEVAIDPELWAIIDPQAALSREIGGASAKIDANLQIRRDLLSPEANVMSLGDPAAIPGRIRIEQAGLDALGVKADLKGALSVFPLPSGAFTLQLTGWRQFFQAVQRTPLAENPQAVSALLMLNDLAATYGAAQSEEAQIGADVQDQTGREGGVGAEGAAPEAEAVPSKADALNFDIRLGGVTGVTINGKPLAR